MDYVTRLPDNILFRDPNPNAYGYFALMKSIFVIDGVTIPYSDRCDNLTYNSTFVTNGSKYHADSMYAGENIPVSNWGFWNRIIEVIPDFCIMYMSCVETTLTGGTTAADYYFQGYPSTLWFAKSIVELLKNIREWSFMVDAPFNSDHPMATYSKTAIDTLNPPQNIMDEIDALPDMHLARFLKGDLNHRDVVENFPQMSDDMRNWFEEKLEEFKPRTTNERLLELNID